MRIKLAIVDQDENYVRRLVNNLQINYSDKIEPYYFSSFSYFTDFISENILHVVLFSEELEIEQSMLSDRMSSAFLVSSKNIEEVNGLPAICKFQKVDLLYKNVLSLFADIESRMVLKGNGGIGRVVLFTSAQGGAGTSTVASAFAIHAAKRGEKVLYLCLDRFHRSEICFHAEGNMSFSDVLYAVKSKKINLAIKLESAIKKDIKGVDFFDACKNANDMLELNEQDVEQLVKSLGSMENYQYIVIDIALDFSPICTNLLTKYASDVIFVNTGDEIGNIKLQRAFEIISNLEKKNKLSIYNKCKLLYNRFSSTTGKRMVDIPVEICGGINKIEGASYGQLVEKLAEHQIMNSIIM